MDHRPAPRDDQEPRLLGPAREHGPVQRRPRSTSSSTAIPISFCGTTREPNGKYVSGKVVGNFGAPINNTFEARVKFECLTPGAWPAWWLVNEQKPRGGEVDLAEWYGNMEWPSGTTVHARLDGTSFATMPFPIDEAWHRWRVTWNTSGMYFWMDYQPGMEPYFEVPANSIDDWPFNDPGYQLRPVFNLAVGGTGGKDASAGNYPCQMLVDWVHIFPG